MKIRACGLERVFTISSRIDLLDVYNDSRNSAIDLVYKMRRVEIYHPNEMNLKVGTLRMIA